MATALPYSSLLKGPLTQEIFVAATQCNFCRPEVTTWSGHLDLMGFYRKNRIFMIGYLLYSTTVWEKLNRGTAEPAEPGTRRERE